jgi:hypothetical protein
MDCDWCRQSYFQAAVSTDPETFFWESYADDLKNSASMHGWETEGDKILCDDCLESEDMEAVDEPISALSGQDDDAF